MKIPYKYAVALTAALGLFMVVLDNTIVNVALIPMANAFKTDINSVQWVITAYFLAQAAVIPAAGYLSSRLGVKRVFIACLALFTLGSLLCGLSDLVQDSNGHPYIGLLIFFRVVQGIGGWGYWEVWAWIIAGLVLLAAFLVYELRSKDPVVDLRLFRERDFTTASI